MKIQQLVKKYCGKEEKEQFLPFSTIRNKYVVTRDWSQSNISRSSDCPDQSKYVPLKDTCNINNNSMKPVKQ